MPGLIALSGKFITVPSILNDVCYVTCLSSYNVLFQTVGKL